MRTFSHTTKCNEHLIDLRASIANEDNSLAVSSLRAGSRLKMLLFCWTYTRKRQQGTNNGCTAYQGCILQGTSCWRSCMVACVLSCARVISELRHAWDLW
jgi:hypothetical protein